MKSRDTKVEGRGPQKQSKDECRESRTGQAQRHTPVTDFERATSYCPLYLAWRILDDPSSQCFDAIKARDCLRTHNLVPSSGSATFSHPMGEGLAEQLAHRAEAVFARHPFADA
jgi:hypothetical protein